MNAYVVRTKEPRTYTEPVLDDGSGPQWEYLPIAPVVAETAPRAKRLFLDAFAGGSRSGVYWDDWTSLRVRLLRRDVELPEGVREGDDTLWLRIHEIEDHNGASCDCPELLTQATATQSPPSSEASRG